jgi:DNA repair exonuclease SbcCD ATPase subunit
LKYLFPSIVSAGLLASQLAAAEKELAAVDTQSFKELENKRGELEKYLNLLKNDNDQLQKKLGSLNTKLSNCREDLDRFTQSQEEKEEDIKNFGNDHPFMIVECEEYAEEKLSKNSIADLTNTYESTLKGFKTHAETNKKEYNKLVADYEHEFHYLLGMEPSENAEAETLLKRLETSELPQYREKIAKAYQDAEKEFKDHFISRLNEHIEEARESFNEINDILRTLHFGRDQYWFHLEELGERKGQIEVIRQAARIPPADDGLFSQLVDPAERKAAEELFNRILNSPLDSKELKAICDYRTYFHYDIRIKETDNLDENGNPVILSLSRVLKEKSGGESQTPYYVAIAASFYRFYKARPESTVRLVIFDEAFNRMDDERIGKILSFYDNLNLQIITSVPPEKIEAIAPFMDRINVISRFGSAVKVRDCHIDAIDMSDIEIGIGSRE